MNTDQHQENSITSGCSASKVVLLGVLLLLVVMLGVIIKPASDTSLQATTKILFASPCSGNYEIYTMRPDGSEIQQITNLETDDREADWSPDNSQIVFRSNRNLDGANPEGEFDIFVMQADGSNVRQLTRNSCDDRHPFFSADGKSVYFVSMTAEEKFQLFSIAIDSGELKQVTHMEGGAKMPSRSKDGSWLLFQTDGGPMTNNTQEIYKSVPTAANSPALQTTTPTTKCRSFPPMAGTSPFRACGMAITRSTG